MSFRALVAEPFGRGHADRYPLADIASEFDADLIQSAPVEVDPAGHVAITGAGQRIEYDALLVAVGARSEPALRRALMATTSVLAYASDAPRRASTPGDRVR